ncbi:RrF2 family transcriptional regulator [Planctomycetota bacterium]
MKFSKGSAYALHALMHMTRHMTQLPISTHSIAKAEGIPAGYLAKLFQQMAKAGLVKAVTGRQRGYVFAKPPEDICLRELFEIFEGKPLFSDCLLKHCNCGGTSTTCRIASEWQEATHKMVQILEEISVANATWSHPEHRFENLPDLLAPI